MVSSRFPTSTDYVPALSERRPIPRERKQQLVAMAAAGADWPTVIAAAAPWTWPGVWYQLQSDAAWADALRAARAFALECRSDELLRLHEYADTPQKLAQARLYAENLRWVLARRLPHTYGDSIEVTVRQGAPDLRAILRECRERAGVIARAPEVIEVVPDDSSMLLEMGIDPSLLREGSK